MEKGLKNLQSAHRSAQKKERGIYGHDDSGISCSDAENDIDDDNKSAGTASATQQSPEAFQVQRTGLSIQSMLSPTPAHQQVQVQMQMHQPLPASTSS